MKLKFLTDTVYNKGLFNCTIHSIDSLTIIFNLYFRYS